MHKNILIVVGITTLFLGLAIQPSIAVNPISSENEDDCSICPKVSKPHLVRLKRLLDRFEKYNERLSVISKHNPEVEGKYQELSDRINPLSEMNKILNSNYLFNFTACVILFLIWLLYGILFIIPLRFIYEFLLNKKPYIMAEIVANFIMIAAIPILPVFLLWFKNCTSGIIMG